VKVRWRQGEFKKRFPQEAEYRRTLAEEAEALGAVALNLQKLKEDPKTAALVTNDRRLSVLVALHQSRLIEPYVLFSLGEDDAGLASDYAVYREKNRSKLEEYLDKFVVAPAPAPGVARKQAEPEHAEHQATAEQGPQAAEANKKEGEAFLAANKTKEGVITLPSGLQYKILKEGNGPKPTAADTVVCNYRGTFLNGTEFDSSYKRGQPLTFPLRGVIRGWTEALQLMPAGSKWQLFIPSDLAYGPRGAGGVIGPSATLVFEVELISIKGKDDIQDKK
jgi:FKBP-type peptidyl-prolyl cis-trans isomerase FklB